MALVYRKNYIPANFFTAIYQLKQDLVGQGWQVYASGTGTGGTSSVGAKGTSRDLITAPTIFSTLSQAWFAITDAAGGRSLLFQNFSLRDDMWRVKYSTGGAGFVGGSPSASVVPSATDEILISGSGTDASPAGTGIFPFNVSGTRRMHWIIDTSDNSFISWYYPSGGQAEGIIMIDPVINPTAGDLDPTVVVAVGNDQGCMRTDSTGGIMTNANSGGATTGYFTWYQKGAPGQTSQKVLATQMYNANTNTMWPIGAGGNTFTVKDDLIPVMWARGANLTGPGGYKGLSKWLFLNGTARATSDLISVSTTTAKDYIHANTWVAIKFWDGSYAIG